MGSGSGFGVGVMVMEEPMTITGTGADGNNREVRVRFGVARSVTISMISVRVVMPTVEVMVGGLVYRAKSAFWFRIK
jgi:hypothetical protein